MIPEFSQSDLAVRIAWALNAALQLQDDGGFRFTNSRLHIDGSVENGALQRHIDALERYSIYEETALVSEDSYEILIQEESPHRFGRYRSETISVSEQDDGLEYELSPISKEYMTWLLSTASDARELRDLGFRFVPLRAERFRHELDMVDPLQALRSLTSHNFLSLKIRSRSKISAKRFQILAVSFLFHLAFNVDVAFVPVRFLEEMSNRGRISRMRRSRLDELDPPRRAYNEDLVAHYILAVSTDSPSVQFLSYYHILEHFFESVFNDDLLDKVRLQLTHPTFSFKRKKDISNLIDSVKKSLQIRSETITFSESEALRLTLGKHVELEDLAAKVAEYDQELVGYYKSNEVPFAKGATVDLTLSDQGAVIRALARRIYATRNSLVHSKEGDRQRYVPFKDERSLLPEIPLMRFIAEQVILKNSEGA